MLLCSSDRFIMALSTLGFVRCHVAPRAVGQAFNNVRASPTRLYRQARSHGSTRSTNPVIRPRDDVSPTRETGEGSNAHEWGTWEFGSWQTKSNAENVAEEAARETPPASLPKLIGAGAGVLDQTDADLDRAVELLRGFMTDDRMTRMVEVLGQRTRSTTIVFENPANPNNVWACLRTLDSFGVQNAHIVSDPSTYSKKARLKTMCTAMGSQKWLTLHGHEKPEDAVAKLKAKGYQVVASDLSPSALSIGEIDWSLPTAVVLGNEERGISDSMRDLADETFVIPMRGFVRSFNMSVACSIILAHLSAVGAIRHGDLEEDERRRILATWLMQSVKGSDRILRNEGIVVPQEVFRPKGDESQTIAGYHVR